MDDLARAVAVLMYLEDAGVRLEANGDHLRFAPRAAVSEDLLERVNASKYQLLAIIRGDSEVLHEIQLQLIWDRTLARLEGDPTFSRNALSGLRRAKVKWSALGEEPPADEPNAARCPRCRYAAYVDVPIHDGRSVRRDCARCGRFLAFPVWYGKPMQDCEQSTGADEQ